MDSRRALPAVLIIPPVIGGLFAMLPLAPPGKMALIAVAAGAFSVVLLGLCVFDTVRPTPKRIAMPLVWLAMSGGFGCLSAAVWTMSRTWGLPIQRLPFGKIGLLLGVMAVLLAASVNGIIRAVGGVGQTKASR